MKELSELSQMDEPDRLIFLAKVHHAMWYNQAIYKRITDMIDALDKNLPEATYFAPSPINHDL